MKQTYSMIRIVITEDNSDAVKALLDKLSGFADLAVKAIASNGSELLQQLEKDDAVDLILMDIEMPVMNGIKTTEKVKQLYPHIKIVMITVYDDDDYIFNAIKAGADSYILKVTKAEKIYDTVKDTLNGGSVMSPSIALKTLQMLKNATLQKAESNTEKILLTDRETEILEQLSKGFSNKTIAFNLIISPFTVKRHIENIYQKLQTNNRIELLDKVRKNGLI